MEGPSIKKKALAAMVVLSFLSASAAFAVENKPKTQEQCVEAVENCYDNVWWIPDWGCDVLYRDCMKDAV